jgi:hypothetical protein
MQGNDPLPGKQEAAFAIHLELAEGDNFHETLPGRIKSPPQRNVVVFPGRDNARVPAARHFARRPTTRDQRAQA